MKKIKSIKVYIITLVLLIVPFFYVLFFLKAFWDPYTDMKNVRVAVVDLDHSELSHKIMDELKKANIMTVIPVKTDEEAKKGLEDRVYYSTITIPANMENELTHFKKVDLLYRSNKKFNFVASTIYERVAEQVKNTLRENIAIKSSDKLHSSIEESVQKLATLENGLKQLKDGSDLLKNGLNTLNGKYKEFNQGINTLQKGTVTLNKGFDEYSKAIYKATDGLDQISGGVVQLGDKLLFLHISKDFMKLYNGAKSVKTDNVKKRLDAATLKVQDGIIKLNDGSSKLADASTKVQDAIQKN